MAEVPQTPPVESSVQESIVADESVVKNITIHALDLCKNIHTSKLIFDLANSGSLSFDRVRITDIMLSPNSFVVELVGTKSYVYYSQNRLKVSYFFSSNDDVNSMDSTLKAMDMMMKARRQQIADEERVANADSKSSKHHAKKAK